VGLGPRRLTSTIVTYQMKGAVRDLGKALGLPEAEIDQLAKHADTAAPGNRQPDGQITTFPREDRCPGLARLVRLALSWTASRSTWGSTRRHDSILIALD